MIHDLPSAQILQKQDGHTIYTIIKPMYPPSYHHNGFMATHTLGYMMHSCAQVHVPKFMNCHKTIVVITKRAHCFHDCIYIFISIFKLIYIKFINDLFFFSGGMFISSDISNEFSTIFSVFIGVIDLLRAVTEI